MPTVRCTVAGPAGRYLVRALYVSPSLHARVHHDLAVAGDGATTLVTSVAIESPDLRRASSSAAGGAALIESPDLRRASSSAAGGAALIESPDLRRASSSAAGGAALIDAPAHARGPIADVAVFDGAPGRAATPIQLVRGEVVLDGSIAVLAAPPRALAGQLARIAPGDPNRALIGIDAPPVWVHLVLPHVALAAGTARVHVAGDGEAREVEITIAPHAEPARAPLRLPLWRDDTLHVVRSSLNDDALAAGARIVVSVTNTGEVAREVWVEHRVPAVRRRRVERAFPSPPVASGDVLRARVVAPAGGTARAGYTLLLEFLERVRAWRA